MSTRSGKILFQKGLFHPMAKSKWFHPMFLMWIILTYERIISPYFNKWIVSPYERSHARMHGGYRAFNIIAHAPNTPQKKGKRYTYRTLDA